MDIAAKCTENTQIHSIGIGKDCSVDLVKEVALLGRGSYSLVPRNKNLKGIVIQALSRASQPSYSNCSVIYSLPTNLQTNNMGYEFKVDEE